MTNVICFESEKVNTSLAEVSANRISQTHSSEPRPAPASANSRRSRCGSNLRTGSGSSKPVASDEQAESAGASFGFSAAGSRSRVPGWSVQELGVEVKTRTLKTTGMRHPAAQEARNAGEVLLCETRRRRNREKRDFSLRRPTTLQEQSGRKKRRPAPFEMTVDRHDVSCPYRASSKKQIPRFARNDNLRGRDD
jgi:hypothetical protein